MGSRATKPDLFSWNQKGVTSIPSVLIFNTFTLFSPFSAARPRLDAAVPLWTIVMSPRPRWSGRTSDELVTKPR